MTQCATCGEANALLFTCSHCGGEFCADHQFPHHACEKFTARSASERAVDWVWGGADGSGDGSAGSADDEPAVATAGGPDEASAGDDPVEGAATASGARDDGDDDRATGTIELGAAADAASDADAGSPAGEPTPGPSVDAGAGDGSGPAGAPRGATDSGRGTPSGTQAGTAGTPPAIEPIARDAAKERRPDRQGPTPPPPGRGFPSDRYDDRTVIDWIREQSYPGYLAKVGSLSLIFTLAYYGGLVAVL